MVVDVRGSAAEHGGVEEEVEEPAGLREVEDLLVDELQVRPRAELPGQGLQHLLRDDLGSGESEDELREANCNLLHEFGDGLFEV